jgi:hypothetical protein
LISYDIAFLLPQFRVDLCSQKIAKKTLTKGGAGRVCADFSIKILTNTLLHSGNPAEDWCVIRAFCQLWADGFRGLYSPSKAPRDHRKYRDAGGWPLFFG